MMPDLPKEGWLLKQNHVCKKCGAEHVVVPINATIRMGYAHWVCKCKTRLLSKEENLSHMVYNPFKT